MTEEPETQTGGLGGAAASKPLKRDTVFASTAGLATAAIGFGALTGTAAALGRFEVDFKGRSEGWLIADGNGPPRGAPGREPNYYPRD